MKIYNREFVHRIWDIFILSFAAIGIFDVIVLVVMGVIHLFKCI